VILTNCRIWGREDADTLVIRGDQIEEFCSRSRLPDSLAGDDEIVDLGGRFVLPGFIDAHVHLFNTGLTEGGWRVALAERPREETLSVLSDAVHARGAGEWVIGSGWDEGLWDSKEYLSREELDRVSVRSPVAAVRMDGHLIVVNTRALEDAVERLPGELVDALVDAKRGEIREEAAWKLLGLLEPDASTLKDALTAAAEHAHALGVTSVHAMMPRNRVPVLLESAGRDRLRVNVYHRVSNPAEIAEIEAGEAYDGKWVRFGGVKAFADGSLGARNAALNDEYSDGGRGELNHSDESMREILERSESNQWQTAVHAIGDRAIDQVIAAHESVGTTRSLRHRIEHAELVHAGHVERASRLGLAFSMQPNFIGNWSGPGSMNERRLGRARDEVSNPLAMVERSGASLAFGSDGMPISPLYGIYSAVNAPYAAQRIGAMRAIRGYTEGGALLSFEEDVKGRLVKGALADLVVMDRNPLEQGDDIMNRRIERVYVGGACVYQSARKEE